MDDNEREEEANMALAEENVMGKDDTEAELEKLVFGDEAGFREGIRNHQRLQVVGEPAEASDEEEDWRGLKDSDVRSYICHRLGFRQLMVTAIFRRRWRTQSWWGNSRRPRYCSCRRSGGARHDLWRSRPAGMGRQRRRPHHGVVGQQQAITQIEEPPGRGSREWERIHQALEKTVCPL